MNYLYTVLNCFYWSNVHNFVAEYSTVKLFESFFSEVNFSCYQRENCMIFSNSSVLAREKFCTSLSYHDSAGFNILSSENLYSKPFSYRIAAVIGGSTGLFCCHIIDLVIAMVSLWHLSVFCKIFFAVL